MGSPEVCRSQLEELLGKAYQHYEALEKELQILIEMRRQTIEQLTKIPDELDKLHKRANYVKLGGSAVGIVGGVVNVAGLALIPVTAGASAIVSGVGAGVAAAGGIATSGASISSSIYEFMKERKAQKAIDDEKRQIQKVTALWNGFGEMSKKITDKIDEAEAPPSKLKAMWRKFKKWVSKFKMCLPVKVVMFLWDCFSEIKGIFRVGVAHYDVGIAILRGLEECGKPGGFMRFMIRCIGLTAVRVFDGLFTGLGLVADIGTFIYTAYDIAKGSHSGVAKQLRETISKLQEEEECWRAAFLAGYDSDIVSATSGSGETNWDLFFKVCRHTRNPFLTYRAILVSVLERVKHSDPDVQLDALSLLEVCVSNCGKEFQLELNKFYFHCEVLAILTGPSLDPRVTQQLKELLMIWAKKFKNDFEMKSLVLFVEQLCSDSISFAGLQHSAASTSQIVQSFSTSGTTDKEEEDLHEAIWQSLLESQSHSAPSHFPSPPTVLQIPPVPKLGTDMAQVITDFEATEDCELSIRVGEIITVVDDSGEYWWWGESSVGQGRFPASFVRGVRPECFIQQSLQKSQCGFSTPSLYPSMPAMTQMPSALKPPMGRAKVIYDFIAAENSELSIRAGEDITVVDDSGESWWWRESPMGQGLFPVSFVCAR